MSTSQPIQESLKALATDIRQYCTDQAELWQQVPNLMLEADGRTGYADSAPICYLYGLWQVNRAISVDCATGRLVYRHRKPLQDADDAAVLELASCMEELDAATLVAGLTTRAQLSRPSHYSPEMWAQAEQHRSHIRQAYGLGYGKPFVRNKFNTP